MRNIYLYICRLTRLLHGDMIPWFLWCARAVAMFPHRARPRPEAPKNAKNSPKGPLKIAFWKIWEKNSTTKKMQDENEELIIKLFLKNFSLFGLIKHLARHFFFEKMPKSNFFIIYDATQRVPPMIFEYKFLWKNPKNRPFPSVFYNKKVQNSRFWTRKF